MPSDWKHVPWDTIEMMKHGKLIMDDDDGCRDSSIKDALKRFVHLGSKEEESSVEAENWPRVKVSIHFSFSSGL